MRLLACLVLGAAGLGGQRGDAQDLLADLSQDRIEIRYSFAGAQLLLFGSIPPPAADGGRRDVVVTVLGPPKPTVVRKKGRVAGIWVNTEAVTYPRAPGFYLLAATRPPGDILPEATRRELGLGLDALDIGPVERATVAATPAGLGPYRAALIRRQQAADLYGEHVGGVDVIDGGLFRADVALPANVPVGRYRVSVTLIDDGRPVASRHIDLRVDKSGFERAIYTLANEQPLFYGLAAVVIALVAGWAAGLVSRGG